MNVSFFQWIIGLVYHGFQLQNVTSVGGFYWSHLTLESRTSDSGGHVRTFELVNGLFTSTPFPITCVGRWSSTLFKGRWFLRPSVYMVVTYPQKRP